MLYVDTFQKKHENIRSMQLINY